MTAKQRYRPWGDLAWALGLSEPRRWHYFGCVGAEERSVKALVELNRMRVLEDVSVLRITDIIPENPDVEDLRINERLNECVAAGLRIEPERVELDASLSSADWRSRLAFRDGTRLCLDVSALPKKFFFSVIKAALESPRVTDFVILYSKSTGYPDRALSENPKPWSTMPGFMCDDPDLEDEAASHLIVGSGFAVDGLRDQLDGRGSDGIRVEVLIPFPAEPWKSVRRSWESAREIEESLGADSEGGKRGVKPSYHRVGALDTSTAFETLLRLTREGREPAALAPLGPKPISVAMCMLASQAAHFPVYYAQPRTYAVDYSSGFERVFAYWIKHEGENLYAL